MTLADLPFILPAFGVLALLFTWWKTNEINNAPEGSVRMAKIAKSIQDGAMAFLKAEYRILLWFVVGVAALLYWSGSTNSPESKGMIAVAFVVGAICSALAGYLGMKVATKANVRTANAAQDSLGKALEIAFAGGSVMGLGVVGLGILGLGGLFLFFGQNFGAFEGQKGLSTTLSVLTGFSFGASSIALFARVGGGIYTKAADVGADLVGKVEAGIPEDHPLNPATIADNVGDNVGGVAGMGADLFESYVGSIIGAMILGGSHGCRRRFKLFGYRRGHLRWTFTDSPSLGSRCNWHRHFHSRNLSRQSKGWRRPSQGFECRRVRLIVCNDRGGLFRHW